MANSRQKIFITGGSGFIGRNIAEYFAGQAEVFAPSHQELELLDEEAVRSYFRRHDFDVVIHSAVRPGHRNAKDPSHQLDHNCRMFFNLARNADRFKKFIFLSSGAVYDARNYQPKMTEEYFDSHVPADEMGFSKYIAAKYIAQAEKIVELRIFGIFGKYEDYAIRFISNMIGKTLFDLPLTMKQDRKFDYLYIDDLMPVLEHFINNKSEFKAYNVTPDRSVELKDLAEKVKKISGKNLPIKVAQPGLGVEYSGDNTRLRQEINGLRFTPIDEAIGQLYAWYLANKSILKKDLLLHDK